MIKINRLTILLLSAITICLFASCNQTASENNKKFNTEFSGSYATDGYAKRNLGYDWTTVSVKPQNNKYQISVRSRTDIKKPTCTFDRTASAVSENTLMVHDKNINILFIFSKNSVRIRAEKEKDKKSLYYYCSGGATLEGDYYKISDE